MALRIFVRKSRSVRSLDRTDLGTVSAPGTVSLHIAGALIDIDLEVADKTTDTLNLGIGHQMDVFVLADCHHLRSTNAGRTVQGWEGLVILEHVPPPTVGCRSTR